MKSACVRNRPVLKENFHALRNDSKLENRKKKHYRMLLLTLPSSDTRSASIIQHRVHTQQINFRVLF